MESNEQALPQNREAEEAVIGSALINPQAFRTVVLSPTDFFVHSHGWIWGAMHNIALQNGNIDILTVSNELKKENQLADIGGPAYLTKIINNTTSSLQIEDYAKEVKAMSYRRGLIREANNLAKIAYDESQAPDVTEVVHRLREDVPVEHGAVPISQVIVDAKEYLYGIQNAKDDIRSPWVQFNNLAWGGGVYRRQTTLLYGRAGVGKSIAAGEYGIFVAENLRVSMYLTEMDTESQILRWVSSRTGVTTYNIKHRNFLPGQEEKVLGAFEHIRGLNIRITDSKRMTSAMIGADLMKHPADFVVVDSIGRLLEKDDNKWDKVETSAQNLKIAADESNCAIFVVATVVKDGTIRGTEETSHICDYTYEIMKPEGADNSKSLDYQTRRIYPSKQRHGGINEYANLKMHQTLPRLEEVT